MFVNCLKEVDGRHLATCPAPSMQSNPLTVVLLGFVGNVKLFCTSKSFTKYIQSVPELLLDILGDCSCD